jgi:hypothetical protein
LICVDHTVIIRPPWRTGLGWAAISISTAALVFWSVWGSIEAFYEGWYYRSFWMNLGLTLAQYLSPVLMLMIAAVVSVVRPRLGALLHLALAVTVAAIMRTRSGLLWLALPLTVLAAAYWFGTVDRKRMALFSVCGLPALTLIVCGAGPAYQVSQRIADGNRGIRVIEGRDVRLRWAPTGPGWPEKGTNWHEARRICSQLSPDGTTVMDVPQHTWRLPTADELVRSMSLHGQNVAGVWDSSRGVPSYRMTPDKVPPLWDPYSPVIYWWTATEATEQRAYRFAFNGRAMATLKTAGPDYYGFRCVSEP